MTPTAVGLIPARSGSERVPGKNVALLGGHPLIAYSIASARQSGVFTAVLVSTDSEEIAEIARRYGAEVPGLRPAEISTSTSPDIEWVLRVMDGRDEDVFAILRPTSPFRTAATIRRAFERLVELGDEADSIRAVEPVRQHPAKMWTLAGDLMEPLQAQPAGETPLHSRQLKSLPLVYAQNSSLELAWSRVLRDPLPTISGSRVAPFLSEGDEGFSIDYPEDLERAERLLASHTDLPALDGGPAANARPRKAKLGARELGRLARVDQPLFLISQAQRSGGTLLLRLLDGHPECHVVPFQLRGLDEAAKQAPLDAEAVWEQLHDQKLVERFRKGHRQQKRDVLDDEDVFPFRLDPERQRAIYDACLARGDDETFRGLVDSYYPSFFNAWEGYRNLAGPKRWLVGFEPGVPRSIRRREAIRRLYPDGRAVSIVRDPWSWYASARRWEPQWTKPRRGMNHWCKVGGGMISWRRHSGGDVRLLRFELLLAETERTMRGLADWLGIEFDRGMLVPTFNGEPIAANTSFSDVSKEVSTRPLERARDELDAETTAYIQMRAGELYDRLQRRADRDWGRG